MRRAISLLASLRARQSHLIQEIGQLDHMGTSHARTTATPTRDVKQRGLNDRVGWA